MHLTVFEAIMRTKGVSLAAETLDVPQPTPSRYLKQLRDHFGNQHSVRTRTVLEPTSIVISSAPAVSQALVLYRTRLSGAPCRPPVHRCRGSRRERPGSTARGQGRRSGGRGQEGADRRNQ